MLYEVFDDLQMIGHNWQRTDVGHVWYSDTLKKYSWEDETSNLDGLFGTKEAAKAVLDKYCKEVLGV
jgi:hypothetical protein